MTETAVRVQTDPATVEERDFSSLLTENLELLRRSESHASQLLVANTAKEAAEKTLREQKEKQKVPGGYRGIRRSVIRLNVLISVLLLLTGPMLWLKAGAPPQVNAVAIAGVIWMIVTCMWLDALADIETRS